MASRSLGTLTLDLIAKIGGFVEGLSKAEREAAKRAQAISKAVGVATGALATMATAAAGVGIAWTKEIAQLAVEVQKLSSLTGATNDEFQRLSLGASTVGISAEKLADIFKDVQDKVGDFMQTGGGAMADFFENIAPKVGVTAEQFRKLSGPDALQLYVSSLEKANLSQSDMVFYMEAIASDASALLPLLRDNGKAFGELGDYAKSVGAIMDEGLIRASKELDVEMKKVDIAVQGVKNAIASQLIPQVLESTKAFREWITDGSRVELISKAITVGFDLVSRACAVIAASIRTVTLQLIALYEAGVAAWKVLTLDFKGAAENWGNARTAASMSVEAFQGAIDAVTKSRPVTIPVVGDTSAAGAVGKLSPRKIKSSGGGGDDPAKKQLEAELKSLERIITREGELMAERNKFLDLYNGQGLLSIRDYYERQANIRDEATQKQSEAYNKQIKLLQDYIAKANPKDRSSAQEKLNDLLEKQAKLQRDAGTAAIEAGIKQTQAMKEYANTIAETNARLLELQGEVGKAAAIRFDIQNEGLLKLFSAEGNQEMIEKVSRIRELTVAQADLNKLSADYGLIQGQLQIAEDRIALAQQMGTQSELSGLVALGEARTKSYDQLKGIVEQYEKIAKLSGDPKMLLQAEQLRLQLDQLGATLDPLADKISKTFEDAFGSAFADFITGTKTAKEAFQDFAKSVVSEIAKLAAQQLAKQLFGGLFSSGGSSGSGGWLSSIIGLFGGVAGKASGGPVAPNTLYRVNERGPEMFQAANGEQFLMTGTQGGSITPNHMLGGGGNVFNVTVPQGTSRQTGSQIAAEAARKLAQAQRNN